MLTKCSCVHVVPDHHSLNVAADGYPLFPAVDDYFEKCWFPQLPLNINIPETIALK